jgi:hypothetical protein
MPADDDEPVEELAAEEIQDHGARVLPGRIVGLGAPRGQDDQVDVEAARLAVYAA